MATVEPPYSAGKGGTLSAGEIDQIRREYDIYGDKLEKMETDKENKKEKFKAMTKEMQKLGADPGNDLDEDDDDSSDTDSDGTDAEGSQPGGGGEPTDDPGNQPDPDEGLPTSQPGLPDGFGCPELGMAAALGDGHASTASGGRSRSSLSSGRGSIFSNRITPVDNKDMGLKEEEDLPSDKESDDAENDMPEESWMYSAMEPYLNWLRMFGQLPTSLSPDEEVRQKSRCAVVLKIYSSLVLACLLFGLGRLLAFLGQLQVLQYDFLAVFALLQVAVFVHAIWNSVFMYKKYQHVMALMDGWREVEAWFTVDMVSEPIKNTAVGLICLALAVLIGSLVLLSLAVAGELRLSPDVRQLLLWPVSEGDPSSAAVVLCSVLVLLPGIFAIQAAICPPLLFVIFCLALGGQFRILAARFEDDVLARELALRSLQAIREKHHYLTRLARKMEEIFSSILWMCFAAGLVVSVNMLYMMIYRQYSLGLMATFIVMFLVVFGLMLAVCLAAHAVQEKMRIIDVYEADVSNMSSAEKEEVSMLVQTVHGTKIPFTACRFFNVGRRTVSVIGTILVMYFFVMVQTHQNATAILANNVTIT